MPDVSRKKSPRAPSLSLDDALARALLIYEKEHRHEISADVAAQDIGYSGANNGAALAALASLRYYGLVERPGEGKLVVARDVETFKFAPEEQTRKKLLKKWVATPPVFADLLAKYTGGLPSEAAIKFELIQRGFTPSSAEDCLTKFIKSVEFAHYFDGEADVVAAPSQEQTAAETRDIGTWREFATSSDTRNAPASAGDRIPIRLSAGRRAWLEIPVPFYEADKERIQAQLALIITDDEET